jgi:Holliday junction resolvase RusA-like endonuclease
MIDQITFIVDAEPVPKQSYRAVKGGGYTDPRVKAWQELVSWRAKIEMNGRDPITGPVSMRVVFCLSNRRRVDLDNLNKGVSDAMNGIVFKDDTQVVNLHLVKHVKKNPGILVQVYAGELLPPFVEVKP